MARQGREKRLHFEVEHDPNHPTEVAANSDGVACGFLAWKLPADPPLMIAVVTSADSRTLTTEPLTLVLQSQEGLLVGADSPLAEKQAKRVLEMLARMPGRKSAGFEQLVRQLGSQGRSSR
jgi:hypothetical protein